MKKETVIQPNSSKVVLELLREEQTLNEVAAKYPVKPQMIAVEERFCKERFCSLRTH
jgi:SH3-like domain-containing protein